MSDVWKVSPSNIPAMERCVSMAGPREVRNKWLDQFRQQHCHTDFGKTLYRLLRQTQKNLEAEEDANGNVPQVIQPKFDTTYDKICMLVEADPIGNFHQMLDEGLKDKAVYKALAKHLSPVTIEKICRQIFVAENLNTQHVLSFYSNFFPIYLKQSYSWFALDILVKANKIYPLAFRNLLLILLKDPEVSNKMMNDFVITLDDAGKFEFLSTCMELELSSPLFAHNLLAIHSAYKASEKSQVLQNYVYNCLIEHATYCLSDWNYGRLFLSFLHAADHIGAVLDFGMIECLIDMHRSPFKRPCMSALSTMIERHNAAELPPNPF